MGVGTSQLAPHSSGVQPALHGPLGLAVLKNVGVRGRARRPVTGGTAAVSARLDFGEHAVGMVSEVQEGRELLWGEEVGNYGTLCSPPECPPGFFGPGCQHMCSCSPGATCDPVSGQCETLCPAGLRGKDCDQGGLLGPRWGPSTSPRTPPSSHGVHVPCLSIVRPVNAPLNSLCSQFTHHLCQLGRPLLLASLPLVPWSVGMGKGSVLTLPLLPHPSLPFPEPRGQGKRLLPAECPGGMFGVNCSSSCACGGAPCDRVTGQCHCPPGRKGPDCAAGESGLAAPVCGKRVSCDVGGCENVLRTAGTQAALGLHSALLNLWVSEQPHTLTCSPSEDPQRQL